MWLYVSPCFTMFHRFTLHHQIAEDVDTQFCLGNLWRIAEQLRQRSSTDWYLAGWVWMWAPRQNFEGWTRSDYILQNMTQLLHASYDAGARTQFLETKLGFVARIHIQTWKATRRDIFGESMRILQGLQSFFVQKWIWSYTRCSNFVWQENGADNQCFSPVSYDMFSVTQDNQARECFEADGTCRQPEGIWRTAGSPPRSVPGTVPRMQDLGARKSY